MKPAQAQLREVSTVALGITLRGADASRHDPDGTHQLIRIGDLSEDGTIQPREANRVKLDVETARRYALRAGDVLLAARGTRMTAAVFDGDYLAVAGGQFLVIRPQESALLPGYLRWFLNLPSSQDNLAARTRGSYVRSLPANALGELEIPIPPIPQQHAIAALHALRLREKDLMARLAARRAVFLDQSILHSFRA